MTEDLKSCQEHVQALSCSTEVEDLTKYIGVSEEKLIGVNPVTTTCIVYDGGVFLEPTCGHMLVTANQHIQMIV